MIIEQMTEKEIKAYCKEKYQLEDICDMTEQEIKDWLKECYCVEVVDKTEVNDIVYSILCDLLDTISIDGLLQLSKAKLKETIEKYTGEEFEE